MIRVYSIKFIASYFGQLRIAFHEILALTGFFVFMVILNQLLSGTMLAFSLIEDSMYVPLVREEEDLESLYIDDFFWMHERGVDYLVISMFIHLSRKTFVNVMDIEQEYAWKSGVALFLGAQVVIFLGLVLCCTHLSDITLTIAVNAFQTFLDFIGKIYWLFAPDQTLNSDTLVRLALAHYLSGFILAFFAIGHGVDMHYDWKISSAFDGIKQDLNWYDEALVKEIGHCLDFLLLIGLWALYVYAEPEALNYEIFMWGDVGMIVDVRFFGVAPHWYFRPYMAWLIVCPYHYVGIFGLVLFFVSFYYQPNIMGKSEYDPYYTTKILFMTILFGFEGRKKKLIYLYKVTPDNDKFFQITYAVFLVCLWYAFSYLPYGRFFNRLGGNDMSLMVYAYIFIYMGSPCLRVSHTYNLYKMSNF